MHKKLKVWMAANEKKGITMARELGYSVDHIAVLRSGKSPITKPFLMRFELMYGRAALTEAFGETAVEWAKEV